jgi:hypothetical protein
MKELVRNLARSMGFDIVRYGPRRVPSDISDGDRTILRQIFGYTVTSVERQITLIEAVRYLVRRGISGSFVECGVWRGGSSKFGFRT